MRNIGTIYRFYTSWPSCTIIMAATDNQSWLARLLTRCVSYHVRAESSSRSLPVACTDHSLLTDYIKLELEIEIRSKIERNLRFLLSKFISHIFIIVFDFFFLSPINSVPRNVPARLIRR